MGSPGRTGRKGLPLPQWAFTSQALAASAGAFRSRAGIHNIQETVVASRYKSPFDTLVLEIKSLSNAQSARAVIAHLRRAGSDIPVRVAVVPGRFKNQLAGNVRLSEIFSDLVDVLSVVDSPPSGWILWASFVEDGFFIQVLGPTHIALPGFCLKGSDLPVPELLQERLRKDLRMSSDRLEIVLASLEEKDIDLFIPLMQDVLARLTPGRIRFIVVPRYSEEEGLWRQKLGPMKHLVAVRRNAVGDVVVIGNTWKAGSAGHSIAEPVFVGTPVLFGKYVGFHVIYVKSIIEAGAGIQCNSLDHLSKKLLEFASDPERVQIKRMEAATAEAIHRIDQQIAKPALRPLFEEWLQIPMEPPAAPAVTEDHGTALGSSA